MITAVIAAATAAITAARRTPGAPSKSFGADQDRAVDHQKDRGRFRPDQRRANRMLKRKPEDSHRGLRVLRFAQRPVARIEDGTRELVESHLTFVGLAALEDPPRPEVADAVTREVGIVHGEPTIVSGAEIDAMPQSERDRLLHDTPELVVARSNPETKPHIVDALRAQGHTVAMTGDGVNDAPALRSRIASPGRILDQPLPAVGHRVRGRFRRRDHLRPAAAIDLQQGGAPAQDLLLLACFPVIIWGSDELWRWRLRRRTAVVMPTAHPRAFADDAPSLW